MTLSLLRNTYTGRLSSLPVRFFINPVLTFTSNEVGFPQKEVRIMSIRKFEKKVGETLSGQIVRVFVAVSPQDRDEGRGPLVDRSYHLSEKDATIATKGIGVMGSDGQVVPRQAVRLGGEEYILLPDVSFTIDTDPAAEAKLREQALKKLSPAERAALLSSG